MHRSSGVVAVLCALALPSIAAAQGGPDPFGYSWNATGYDFVPLAGGLGAPLSLSDDGEATVALPFSFPFYDAAYSDVVVSSNGAARFTTGAQVGYQNECLPSGLFGSVDVAVYWDDFNPANGGGVYTYDDAANDRFIVSWEAVPHYSGGGEGTFQLHLYDTGEIQIHWDDVDLGDAALDFGASATVGIQDLAGGGAASFGYALEVSCDDATVAGGTAVSFECGAADTDGDGVGCGDCDDNDASVFPGAAEVCDGIDQDCDGAVDEGFTDADGDDSASCLDCDDGDDTVFPGAPELCDGQDNDCNGLDDFGNPGFGGEESDDDGDLVSECEGDCDDDDIFIFPGAAEVCGDEIDNDCSGVADQGTVVLVGGGGGTPIPDGAEATIEVDAVTTFASTVGDVDVTVNITHAWDEDLDITLRSPAGIEVILSDDNGGDGDDYTDTTFDDEALASILAGSPPFTGVWQPEGALSDFDGESAAGVWQLILTDDYPTADDGVLDSWTVTLTVDGGFDDDGDGVTVCEGDCDDDNDEVFPGNAEVCDGFDNDCNDQVDEGFTDGDGDAAADCVDCDDTDELIFPGALELCDGVDGDCDGLLDAGLEDVDGQETDDDGDGVVECDGDCDDDNDQAFPGGDEVCDGADNDCDEGTGETTDEDGDGFAECDGDCDDDNVDVSDGLTEVCDALDNDCDEEIDEGFDGDGDGAWAAEDCSGAYGLLDCDDDDDDVFPGAAEVCNGLDDNCNAVIDEDLMVVDGLGAGAALANSLGPQQFELEVVGPAFVADVDVVVEIEHAMSDDLDIYLFSPSGTLVSLSTDNGGVGAGLVGTVFDDDAIDTIVGADPPFSGSFQPEGFLASLVGEDAAGTWILQVNDDTSAVDGALIGWQLYLSYDGDGDGAYACDDCDDDEAAVVPGDPELCDGLDNDCSGAADFGGAPELDGDGDGVFDCEDCDDADADNFPGNPEVCDGQDNDCDTGSDEAADLDGDGQTLCDGDCDDGEAAAYAGAAEVCDGIDNDCDGAANFGGGEELDLDEDGSADCEDCEDEDSAVNPGLPEVCDGLDNDCDPATDEGGDVDGDGVTLCEGDCDDGDALVWPGAPEVCDGVDDDCDGAVPADETVDGDGDGWALCFDCDDADDTINPDAVEVCDGLDDDCDGIVPADEIDNDGDGAATCDGDCDDDDPDSGPEAPELCDGLDNDCDGTTGDEELDVDGDGLAPCDGDCDDAAAESFPGADEVCDGLDNDCDEVLPADEADADGDGTATCEGDCDDDDPAASPDGAEDDADLCADAIDNDCDGDVDEDDADCADVGDDDDSASDDDDSADDDDDATDDDDDAADDDDSAGSDTTDCDCESSVAGGGWTGLFGCLLIGAAAGRRRRR